MTYTIQEIEDCLKELATSIGLKFETPVKINKRLTRTLGRVVSELMDTGEYKPLRVEFSERLLRTCTDESIQAIIQHEFCHWAVLIETGEVHHHDKVFKAMCRRVGCDNDRSFTNVERIVKEEELFKYTVKCKDCGHQVYYDRKGKTIKNLKQYQCGRCGGDLKLIENW